MEVVDGRDVREEGIDIRKGKEKGGD